MAGGNAQRTVGSWTISTTPRSARRCERRSFAVSIRYTVVPTSAEGVADAAARYAHTDLLASIVWWERSMNHYLRTRQLLRRGVRQ